MAAVATPQQQPRARRSTTRFLGSHWTRIHERTTSLLEMAFVFYEQQDAHSNNFAQWARDCRTYLSDFLPSRSKFHLQEDGARRLRTRVQSMVRTFEECMDEDVARGRMDPDLVRGKKALLQWIAELVLDGIWIFLDKCMRERTRRSLARRLRM